MNSNLFRVRELLAEVKSKDQLLEKRNQEVGKLHAQAHEFVDHVSHEFRTPLTVIKEYVSLIREGLAGEVNEEQGRLLNIVEDRADDLNIMVDDMLDVSKLEAGMLGAWRKNCRVGEIFEHVQSSLQRKAKVKNVDLRWELDSDLPEVYCDSERAGRVVTNLAINAIKFCGDPGVVQIGARADLVAREVAISIIDNGPGVDKEALNNIFRRLKPKLLTRSRSSTKGFGLGLNIAKELAELNLGRMSVQSQLGTGSTFCFTVPVADPLEVMRRYLKRIERVEDATSNISVVLATIDESLEGKSPGDVDAFLNFCLQRNDLLFRIGIRRWLVALPKPHLGIEQYFHRIGQEWKSANRNRPFSPLPHIDMTSCGSWPVAAHQDKVLGCVSEILKSTEVAEASGL